MPTYQAMLHTSESHGVTLAGPDEAAAWEGGHAELLTRRTAILSTYCRVDVRWSFSRRRVRFMYSVSSSEHGSGISGHDRMRWPGVEPALADYPESADSRAAFRS